MQRLYIVNKIVVAEHSTFGYASCPGGIDNRGQVIRQNRQGHPVEIIRVTQVIFFTAFFHFLQTHHPGWRRALYQYEFFNK